MGPGVIGAGVMHINLFADLIIASFLPEGSISYLYYADRLNQLPLGVVGIAVGTALLPMLSRSLAKADYEDARSLFNRSLEFCLLLALPAAVALAVIPQALITVLFERGAFTQADSTTTAYVLMCYAAGLPAYIAIKVFSTAHWARQDTVTPVKIAVVATLMNIALSLGFIQVIGVAGIALATGLTGWVQFFAHLKALKSHEAVQFDARFKRAVPRIIVATLVMAGALYIGNVILHDFFYQGWFSKVLALTILVVGGKIVYAAAVLGTGVLRVQDITRYIRKA